MYLSFHNVHRYLSQCMESHVTMKCISTFLNILVRQNMVSFNLKDVFQECLKQFIYKYRHKIITSFPLSHYHCSQTHTWVQNFQASFWWCYLSSLYAVMPILMFTSYNSDGSECLTKRRQVLLPLANHAITSFVHSEINGAREWDS